MIWFVIGGLVAIVISQIVADIEDSAQEKRDREMLKKLLKDK